MIESMYISIIGIIYLLMLFVPNMIWTKYQPVGYSSSQENKILLFCEKIGQILVTIFSVVIFNKTASLSIIWLALSMIFMVLYECYWIRYFRSDKQLPDFYRSFLRIPVPGAFLPIIAFALLSVYHLNIPLLISTLILGIGHIGIHLQHLREIDE
ncbi:MAG: hypothetical protein RR630_00425 [Coprobacillus sp.]